MQKTKSVLLSFIWALVLLAFPVVSGIIVVIFNMNQIKTLLVQGCFMLISIAIPLIYICKKKISTNELGLRKIEQESLGKVLLFIPLILSELPLVLIGVNFKSYIYISALILFSLAVGISEELYFRGIILKLLKDTFSNNQAILISALIFGIGHIASILAGNNLVEVLLQIINAIVFGVISAEVVIITKSIIPTIIWHFAFNFVNHITVVTGRSSVLVIGLQEIIMVIYAYYLWKKTQI